MDLKNFVYDFYANKAFKNTGQTSEKVSFYLNVSM